MTRLLELFSKTSNIPGAEKEEIGISVPFASHDDDSGEKLLLDVTNSLAYENMEFGIRKLDDVCPVNWNELCRVESRVHVNTR